MTALEMIRTLKENREAILWLRRERNEAIFVTAHGCDGMVAVDMNDALITKGDPAIDAMPCKDGEIYSAHPSRWV